MQTDDVLEIALCGESIRSPYEIVDKYNQPGPRYTSYPTVPEWNPLFTPNDFIEAVRESNARTNLRPLSLYFHLPFCESLCLYCACTTVITKNHQVCSPYLERVKRELSWMSQLTNPDRKVEQIHLGGGTPTFLSTDELKDLYGTLTEHFSISPTAEISVEVDPRATTEEHCRTLKELGFNRVSLGVQDFNPAVQQAVHRIQSLEMVKNMIDLCRQLGFESINVDLIYGLPHQTLESFEETTDKVIELRPDRIAMFSYAHVPWMKRQQKILERYLPSSETKFHIFTRTIQKLTQAGYRYIGMDHFALNDDELCHAQDDRTLHRNFQGYTTKANCDLYGIGMSSISSLDDVYAQNWHTLPQYSEAIDSGSWATMRGSRLTSEDKMRRSIISRILCHCILFKSEIEREFGVNFDEYFALEMSRLQELEQDQLVRIQGDRIEVSALGRIFIRNVAMVFDAYLRKPQEKRFSKTL